MNKNFFEKKPVKSLIFKPVTSSEIKNLIVLIQIKPQEQTRFHRKIAADFLTPLLTVAINKSIKENICLDSAKIASVIPLDKGKPNKNEISNHRPVSVLNTFSRLYEKVIKKQLVRFMEEYLSPLISAYRTNYSSQHVIIRLLEECRKKLDDNFVVGAVLTDLSKLLTAYCMTF